MLLPKLLGTAERAWAPDPGWGTGSANASYDSAWNIFLNTCGKRLLPRLSRLDGGYAYRIPPPGVVCRDGRIWANCLLPGFTIRYTTNGSEPTAKSPRYTAPLIYKSGTRVRVFDGAGRGGRSITVNNEHI
jgi:hexosaminidase